MNSFDERRKQIEKEYHQKLVSLKKEESLDAQLPRGSKIHVYPLYGTIAGVTYGDPFGKTISYDQAVQLTKMLPPIDLKIVDEGSIISFRPLEYVTDTSQKNWIRSWSISPIIGHVENAEKNFSIEWMSRLPSLDLIRVHIFLGRLPIRVGTYSTPKVEYIGGYKYDRCNFTPTNGLKNIHRDDEEDSIICTYEKSIVWGTGGSYPNKVSFYFKDTVEVSSKVSGVEIMKTITRLATQ